jgi:N-acetylmuramoyl-L-alanine amidase
MENRSRIMNKWRLALALLCVFVLGIGVFGFVGGGNQSVDASILAVKADIPAGVLNLYIDAATTCPGLDPFILAGIGSTETDHGRSNMEGVHSGTNFAGAAGPMQFLKDSTWKSYGVDGDHDGVIDIYSLPDSIYSAARYLCDSGARDGLDIVGAIWHYNPSLEYRRKVLEKADYYRRLAATLQINTSGVAHPGLVYILGDSIAQRIETLGSVQFATRMTAMGWPVAMDTLDKRAIAHGPGPNGLEAIDRDAATVFQATVIMVELGTNLQDGADFEANARSLIEHIRTYNTSAPIYWTNLATTTSPAELGKRNSVLGGLEREGLITLIDWYSQVFSGHLPGSGDSGLGATLLEDGVHPTNPDGIKVLADLWLDRITSTGNGSQSGASYTGPIPTTCLPFNADTSAVTGPARIAYEAAKLCGFAYRNSPEDYTDEPTSTVRNGQGAAAWVAAQQRSDHHYDYLDCSGLSRVATYRAFGVDPGVCSGGFLTSPYFHQIPLSTIQPGDMVILGTACGLHGEGHIAVVMSYSPVTDLLVTIEAYSRQHPSGYVSRQLARSRFEFAVRYVGPGLTAPQPATGGSSTTIAPATSNPRTKPTIVLDPGHAPGLQPGSYYIDPLTNVSVHDYNNPAEMAQMFQAALTIKQRLEHDGYNVMLTKQSAGDDVVNLRSRAEIANALNASLGVSLHSTPGGESGSAVYYPQVGQYLLTSDGSGKVVYSNSQLAATDMRMAEVIAAKRQQALQAAGLAQTVTARGDGGSEASGGRDWQLDGKTISQSGTLWTVQYFAQVPWVYSEQARHIENDTGQPMPDALLNAYIEGIVLGIEAAVPVPR